ncbi:MAG: DnaD domain protein [Chloroflexi bacterium]|nr:DnaD domain protein [Chloroflexota bacterium]MBU1751582.1 DnaD domain protein [Chloroflexota bacterium]MBU1879424.1 DnaD domain protein [Chloroflexota bacterium]
MRQVRLPDLVFSELLPAIDDLAEFKVTLHVLWRLQRAPAEPPAISYRDLATDEVLMAGLRGCDEPPLAALQQGLDRAVARGTLLQVLVPGHDGAEPWYLVNTPRGREACAQAQRGELVLAGQPARMSPGEPALPPERPNIFGLYEQNIGLLTPLIAEELAEAEDHYPPHWIEDAFREAVRANKRNWRYVAAILRRWERDGIARGDTPGDEYYQGGKYGHLIQR